MWKACEVLFIMCPAALTWPNAPPMKNERERNDDLVALLTPLIKAYCAERGFEVCIEAMQVHGGCGYTTDYPVEQLARDARSPPFSRAPMASRPWICWGASWA
jgi:alkylation response protein AidB-like acyl-CoA dehydrogenase